MQRRTFGKFILVSFFLACTLQLVTPALAVAKKQCHEVSSDEAANKRRAGRWFKRGQRLTEEMRLKGALESYLCSFKLMPHEHTVFNIAQLTKFLKDKEEAQQILLAFIAQNPQIPYRSDLEEIADELAADAGVENPPSPPMVPAEPVAEPTVAPGPEPEPEPQLASETPALEDRKPPINYRLLSYISLGVAGASLITGVSFQIAAAVKASDARETGITQQQFQDAEDDRGRNQTIAIAGYVAAAVFGGAGALLLFLDSREPESAGAGERIDVQLGLLPGSLVLTGRF